MDLSSNIQNISEDALNQLFSDTPLEIPSTPSPTQQSLFQEDTLGALPNIDLDDLEKDGVNEPPADDKPADDAPPADVPPADAKPDDAPPADDKDKDKKPDEPTLEDAQIKYLLKQNVNYLVEKGLLPDFDGRDELDITEDSYAELLSEGYLNKATEMFGELVDSTGDYGKVIIHHIKNGGNPDDIIDLFKEQKQIENFDVSDERGQLTLIEKYYQEEIGWSKAKVDKYITSLKGAESGLEDEAKEIQGKYDEIYSKQLEEIKRQQDSFEKEQKVARETAIKEKKAYLAKVQATVDESKVLTEDDKKLIKNSILKFDKKLDNGTPVNDFYLKLYEMQKDPAQYIKLVHFVMDMDGYDKKVAVTKKGDDVNKSWKFIKGNAAIVNKSTGANPEPAKTSNKRTGLNFSGLLNK